MKNKYRLCLKVIIGEYFQSTEQPIEDISDYIPFAAELLGELAMAKGLSDGEYICCADVVDRNDNAIITDILRFNVGEGYCITISEKQAGTLDVDLDGFLPGCDPEDFSDIF